MLWVLPYRHIVAQSGHIDRPQLPLINCGSPQLGQNLLGNHPTHPTGLCPDPGSGIIQFVKSGNVTVPLRELFTFP